MRSTAVLQTLLKELQHLLKVRCNLKMFFYGFLEPRFSFETTKVFPFINVIEAKINEICQSAQNKLLGDLVQRCECACKWKWKCECECECVLV